MAGRRISRAGPGRQAAVSAARASLTEDLGSLATPRSTAVPGRGLSLGFGYTS